jgi:thiol:disulfide interchange protein DsbD
VSVYVLGIAITFSSLGLFAALSGKAFGTFLANRWVLVGLFVFFAVMASSMFGAFDLALPEPIMARLNRVGGTGFGGAFGMGLVAGLIAAPCTGPVLTSLLTFVATSGQPVFGVSLLFVHALGIGVPFFLIGAFSFSLPRSGAWMEGVKSVFGVALLVLGFGYLRDAFPAVKAQLQPLAQVVAFAGVAAGVGVLLGAVHASFHGDVLEKLRKAAGVAIVVFAITARMTFSHAEGGTQVVWVVDHDAALAQAKLDGRPAMIDFTAEWCAACKELEKFTYTDPLVAAESARFVNVKIDSTIEDDRILALQKKYGVKGLPTVVFVDAQGVLLEKPRVTGFVEGPEYLGLMQQVK